MINFTDTPLPVYQWPFPILEMFRLRQKAKPGYGRPLSFTGKAMFRLVQHDPTGRRSARWVRSWGDDDMIDVMIRLQPVRLDSSCDDDLFGEDPYDPADYSTD